MAEPAPQPSVHGAIWIGADSVLRGYAVDRDDLTRRVAVEILLDGAPTALVRADRGMAFDGLADAGDGCHGFAVPFDPALLDATCRITAQVANRDEVIASIDIERDATHPPAPRPPRGMVRREGGMRLTGHVARERDGDPVPWVKVLVDGVEVARSACRGWIELDGGGVARRLDLHLPASLADGRVRSVEVLTEDGDVLQGSPCLVVGFPDPLVDWIEGHTELASEKLRARFIDGLFPRSVPSSEIEAWLERFPPPQMDDGSPAAVAVAIVGEGDADATLASLREGQVGADWRAAVLPLADSAVSFDLDDLRQVLREEAAECDTVVLVIAGTTFGPGALALLAQTLARHPRAPAVYPDLLVRTPNGARRPLSLPSFDPELFVERGYCGLVYAVRREHILDQPAGTVSLFDIFPGDVASAPDRAPIHLPYPLATVPDPSALDLVPTLLASARTRFAAAGEDVSVAPVLYGSGATVRISRAQQGAVSALIAVRDDPDGLSRTLRSLEGDLRTGRDEIIVIDNGSTEPRTLELLAAVAQAGHRVLTIPGWFCRPRLLSLGAEEAKGDHLLFIEAGVAGDQVGWIGELGGRLAASGVGAVGGVVHWTSGVIRDAGFVLGPRFSLAPRFVDRVRGDPGPAGRLEAAHGCSTLSAACLMTPRALFGSLGGFDAAQFPRHLFAPDYCLRVAEKGARSVITPHVSLSFASERRAERHAAAAEHETRLFAERWAVTPGCDPFYSPWMTQDGTPFSGLAWPPCPFAPRTTGGPDRRTLSNRP